MGAIEDAILYSSRIFLLLIGTLLAIGTKGEI